MFLTQAVQSTTLNCYYNLSHESHRSKEPEPSRSQRNKSIHFRHSSVVSERRLKRGEKKVGKRANNGFSITGAIGGIHSGMRRERVASHWRTDWMACQSYKLLACSLCWSPMPNLILIWRATFRGIGREMNSGIVYVWPPPRDHPQL